MISDLARWQRRIKPEKRRTPLAYSDRSALPFFPDVQPSGPVMLDTCAYIDALNGRMPLALQAALAGRRHFHCTVCLGELTFGIGAIDPRSRRAAADRAKIEQMLTHIEVKRTVTLSAGGWLGAGLIAGMLGRIQNADRADRRRYLADTVIYLAALSAGATLITANWRDFDLIGQIVGDADDRGRMLFYAPADG